MGSEMCIRDSYARRGCPRLHSHRGASSAAVLASLRFTDMLSLVSDYPHICLLPDLLQQLLLTLLLLSWSAHSHAVRFKDPLRLHRRGCPRLNSRRGASSAAVLASLRRDTTLPACSYAFTIGKFRRWWYSSPPCCTGGGRRLMPTGLSLCLAFDDAGLHLNQRTHREQGPAPISSPMKLHQGLIFASLECS